MTPLIKIRKVDLLNFVAWIGILFLVSVLCMRLFFSAFTSGDDGYTEMAALSPRGFASATLEMAIFQGRFYQLLVYPIAMIPFLGDTPSIANLFKIFTFISFLTGFYYFSLTLLGRHRAVICLVLFLCLFDTVGGSYNPFHGLPLWFGLGGGLLLLSLGLYLKSQKHGASENLAYFTYFCALLTYEIVILYAPLFIIFRIYLHGNRFTTPWLANWFRAARESWVLIVYVVSYLALYAGFKLIYPGTYSGIEGFTLAPAKDMLRPIVNFSLNSLYLRFGFSGSQGATWLSLAVMLAGVGSFIAAWMVAASASKQKDPSAPAKEVEGWTSFSLLVAYIFIPNVLFGFTLRYRIWAADGVVFYLGSLFSAFAFVLVIDFCLRSTDKVIGASSGKFVVGTLLIVLLSAFTYSNSRNSENFFAQSRLMSSRWEVANWGAQILSSELSTSDDSVVICGKGFSFNRELPIYFRNPDLIADVDVYWSRYFERRLNRSTKYLSNAEKATHCDAHFDLSYEKSVATIRFGDIEKQRILPRK